MGTRRPAFHRSAENQCSSPCGGRQLERRNVKLDLLLAIVDAGLCEPCDRVAVTLADADCITTKRGAMWRRLFRAAIDSRPAVCFDAEGVDGAQKGGRARACLLYTSPSPRDRG